MVQKIIKQSYSYKYQLQIYFSDSSIPFPAFK